MTYGLMPAFDYRTFDAILENVHLIFPSGRINTLEIGVHNGDTSRGIRNRFLELGRDHLHTGIDNQRDFKMGSPFPECNFIVGDSKLVYNKIQDNSMHLVFIDGNHNYPSTILDFMLYKSKVIEGGFILFHDCGPQIKLFTDYQGEGDKGDSDMWIACRKAVKNLGLLDNQRKGWRFIACAADETKHTGGIAIIRKETYLLGDEAWYYGGEQPCIVSISVKDLQAIRDGKANHYHPVNQSIL